MVAWAFIYNIMPDSTLQLRFHECRDQEKINCDSEWFGNIETLTCLVTCTTKNEFKIRCFRKPGNFKRNSLMFYFSCEKWSGAFKKPCFEELTKSINTL